MKSKLVGCITLQMLQVVFLISYEDITSIHYFF
jgi:hypothetical protein